MTKKIKFIYWFAYYHLDSPSVRYRGKYPLDYAKENLGINSLLIIPGYSPKRLMTFIYAYLSALLFPKKNSIIVVQRVHSNFIYSNLLKFLVLVQKKRAIYDLDDADYLTHRPTSIYSFAKKCGYVFAGSREISNHLSQYNKRSFHLSSPIVDLKITKQQRAELFTIGWIGGFHWGHKESLYQLVFPAIKELAFECRFIIIGVVNFQDALDIRNYFKNCKKLQLEIPQNIDWNNERDLQMRIQQFDLGVATLSNNTIQRAKSGIKAKQYLNNGIPVLCNDLPENNHVVIDSYNGFICNSSDEFKSRITQLKEMDIKEYLKLSENARKSSTRFSLLNYFKQIEQEIEIY